MQVFSDMWQYLNCFKAGKNAWISENGGLSQAFDNHIQQYTVKSSYKTIILCLTDCH